MLSLGRERWEKGPRFSSFFSFPGTSLRIVLPHILVFLCPFFSDYKDRHSKVLILVSDVAEASAILARKSVIYVLKKNSTGHTTEKGPGVMLEGRQVSSYASDPGQGWSCLDGGAGRTCSGFPTW